MKIAFDMDGTIADLYGVDNWLDMLINGNPTPYKVARTLLNMSLLARYLNKLQKLGHEIGIISWLAKGSDAEYDEAVTRAKKDWLKKHLKSVDWDFIEIVPYGTDKNIVRSTEVDILFDDEINNRRNWKGRAYSEKNIIPVLKKVAAVA